VTDRGAPLAVAVGDPAGVGPLVAAAAAARLASELPLALYGDADALAEHVARAGIDASRLVRLEAGAPLALAPPQIALVHVGAWPRAAIEARCATALGGRAALDTLDAATLAAREGRARALVTGPLSKHASTLAGASFRGQTEWLARAAGLDDDAVTMLFLGPRLALGLVTTHLAVRDVPGAITEARVARAAAHLGEALAHLGSAHHARPVVAVAALNPHAGEAGLFGDEEARAIVPGIEAARTREPFASGAAELVGPIPAETALRLAADGVYDGVVAMMHDQATIASKLLDWGEAVNVTWGLPFVRTSVDHGVAHDAAARGEADPRGMIAAIEMAARLSRGRDPG
jgi:4-hydroxythreonine-4-phosphate dehydrogenase